jgi:hypothetical protein
MLKIYAVSSTLVLVVLVSAAFTQPPTTRTRFEEIDVERINIVEADGSVRLVLSNAERQTPGVIDGRQLPARPRPAGMIFFNEEGDEVGGLVFNGRRRNGSASALGLLTFDQWKQDQTVVLQYSEGTGGRQAGLAIFDRPESPLTVLLDLVLRREAASEDERAEIDDEIAALQAQAPRRMFVGKDREERSILALADGQGRQRLVLAVDRDGVARIQFFDESGNVVREVGANDR